MAIWRALALTLLVMAGAWTSGCTKVAPKSPTMPEHVAPVARPNFLGNWSELEGQFLLIRLTATVRVVDTNTSQVIDPGRCLRPFMYRIDEANQTFMASKNIVLHPNDPGPLYGVYMLTIVRGPQCQYEVAWAINRDAPPLTNCVRGLGADEAAQDDPWRCNMAIDVTTAPGFLFANSTLWYPRSESEPARYALNGHELELATGGNLSFSARHPSKPWLDFQANVSLAPTVTWPYSAIRRP
jgi:hypothetical protein